MRPPNNARTSDSIMSATTTAPAPKPSARNVPISHGTIRSVEHTIQHLEDLAANLEQSITDTRKRLTDTQTQVETPFEYAEKLTSLVQRQQEIEDALDLTKHQASGQLAADQTDDASA